MQNRFGIKDFVVLVLLAVAILVGFLNLVEKDRQGVTLRDLVARTINIESQAGSLSTKVGDLQSKLDSSSGSVSQLSQKLDRVESQLGEGIKVKGELANASSSTPAGTAASVPVAVNPGTPPTRAKPSPTGADASWARPGVEILWQPTPAPKSDPKAVAGFQPGGEITEIWEAQTKTLTPSISTDVYSRRVQELVLESLADYDPQTLLLRGVLADAWQIDPDGLWLRAHLRSGVRFSDGKPVTAEDVRYSFHDYIMNEQIDAERERSTLRDSIDKVKVIDDRTVEFTFKEQLFTNVSNALGYFILPKHVYAPVPPAQINRATGFMVGSGPYRLRGFDLNNQWAPPKDIVLERNEQYWGAKPALASLRYQAINEEVGRLNALFAGEAEIITPTAPQFISKREDPNWTNVASFNKWVNMRSGYSFIAWNCGERKGKLTPFADKRVRLGMTLALDRQRMLRDIWGGVGELAHGNQPLGSPGSNPDIKPWPYDKKRALELFKQAGFEDRNGDGLLEDSLGNPFTFEYTYVSGSAIGDSIAKFAKDAYSSIGIKVETRGVEWAVYTDLIKTRDFDAITLAWGANSPESDPVQIFHSKSIKDQGDNFAQWSNPEADRLIDAGRRELDDVKRAAIWRQVETVLHEEQPYTFVRVPPWLRLVRKNVGNFVMYPKGVQPEEYFRFGPSTPKPGM